jgi:hypothetical protein
MSLAAVLLASNPGQPSLTQDVYMARGIDDPRAAVALEQGLSGLFLMHNHVRILRKRISIRLDLEVRLPELESNQDSERIEM